jgi:hypothetical protein
MTYDELYDLSEDQFYALCSSKGIAGAYVTVLKKRLGLLDEQRAQTLQEVASQVGGATLDEIREMELKALVALGII